MKKPLLNESRIRYWLTSFKSGNVDDEDYQRRVIDTLVNSVYVYDDEDGGKRIVLTFNLSGNNTATLTSSDIECYAPPKEIRRNTVSAVFLYNRPTVFVPVPHRQRRHHEKETDRKRVRLCCQHAVWLVLRRR